MSDIKDRCGAEPIILPRDTAEPAKGDKKEFVMTALKDEDDNDNGANNRQHRPLTKKEG